jgi:hypothetical protein
MILLQEWGEPSVTHQPLRRNEDRALQEQQLAGLTEVISEGPAPKAILSITNPARTSLVLNRDLRDEKLVTADITDCESEGASSYLTTGSGRVS